MQSLPLKSIVPIAADLVALLGYVIWLPALTARFQQKSAGNAVLIIAVYLLFCGAVYAARVLPVGAEARSRPGLAALAIFFGLMVVYMVADSAGLFATLDGRDVAPGVAPLLVAVLALGLAFLYPALLLVRVDARLPAGSARAVWVQFFALLAVNLMIVVTVAHWEATFAGVEPYDGLALGGKLLIFLLVYAFFLLFYAPPRLLFLKATRPGAVITFFLQTGTYVWRFLAGSAW